MVTINEATRIAELDRGVKFNYYEEFSDVFLLYDNDDLFAFDGPNAPVVVERFSGIVTRLNEFLLMYPKKIAENQLISTGLIA